MGYAATTGFIVYWNPYQHFVIQIAHHVWFDEYNSHLSIEDKRTSSYLLLQQYPGSHIHNIYLLNLIPCELYLTSTPFFFTKILTYEIELPTYVKKAGFNLLYDE